MTLLQAMIAIAWADDDFADVERERIEQMMQFLRLGGRARDYIEDLLYGDAPPPLPDRSELPAYHTRLYIFQHALIMAFEDGIIEEGEREQLKRLADLFELDPEHVAKGWLRAKEMSGV